MKKVAVLGSTGSIGTQTLDVVRANDDLEVVGLAAGSNVEMLEKQIREFHPRLVAVWKEEAARDLGASRWKAFWSVTFKLTLPGLLSGVILTFIPSMGLFFIADILGGNKIVLVGSLIQEQMTRGNNWPFAAALAVVLMILTTLMIVLYRKITNVKELEGIG